MRGDDGRSSAELRLALAAAEREVARLRRTQARLLELAEGWPEAFQDKPLRADMVSAAVRDTILGTQ